MAPAFLVYLLSRRSSAHSPGTALAAKATSATPSISMNSVRWAMQRGQARG